MYSLLLVLAKKHCAFCYVRILNIRIIFISMLKINHCFFLDLNNSTETKHYTDDEQL